MQERKAFLPVYSYHRNSVTQDSAGNWQVWEARAKQHYPADAWFRDARWEASTYPENYVWCSFCGTQCQNKTLYSHPCAHSVMLYRAEKEKRKGNREMANVVICDPCGKVTAARVAGECDYRPNAESLEHKEYTLCPGCSEKVYDVLHPDGPRATPILRGFDPAARAPRVTDPAETTRAALEAEYGESA